MAGGPSLYLANRLLDKSLKNTDFTPPSTWYVALFTTASEANLRSNSIATASEVPNAGAYARKPLLAFQVVAASGGASTFSIDIVFDTATVAWGTVYQAALMDTSAWGTGNIWYFGPLSSSVNVQIGDYVRIPAGDFVINQ